MKRAAVAAAIALLCLACGDSSDTAPASPARPASPALGGANGPSRENQPPTLDSAQILPLNATASDSLSVQFQADDPDHDRLTTTYEWYRNGELLPEEHGSSTAPGRFAKGDVVHAIVYVADREHQVSLQTSDVTIHNAPPRVDRVTLAPPHPTGQDLIEAEAVGHDDDSDPFTFQYRWFKNGQEIQGATGPRLQPGTVRRGDQLQVQVAGSDGSDVGPETGSSPIAIQNSSPLITSQPNYELGPSGHYSYEVAAKDPDGDEPLRYELTQAPPGMTVDVTTGRVTWNVPPDAKGTYQIELAVSDGFGGKTLQNYALAVDWNEAPASPKRGEEAGGAPARKSAKEKAAAAAKQKGKATLKAKPSGEDDTEQEPDQDQDQEQNGEADEEQF